MIRYAILRPSGCIAVYGHDRALPEGAIELPDGIDTSHYLHEGAWLPRPVLARDGLSYPVPVTWEVYDAESSAWLGGAVDTSLTLPDPGSLPDRHNAARSVGAGRTLYRGDNLMAIIRRTQEALDRAHREKLDAARAQCAAARAAEFARLSDPLIGPLLRSEITLDEFAAVAAEIRARNPYPEETK